MKYRPFGKLGIKVSALGFGCMRLPTLGSREKIDEPEATRMVHYAIDHGVNYFDTGHGYHGGNSERFLGRALKGGYREKVLLATKLPLHTGEMTERGDFDRLLNEQLARLQTDYLDFYLIHGIRLWTWEQVSRFDITSSAEKALADGRIRHFGFSFHATPGLFREIIDSYDGWSMCQIQYNFMNENYQAGTAGLEYAASKGIGVVVMEPLQGGKLANPPRQVQEVWDGVKSDRTPVEWALQWLWNKPEVSVVLSGMSAMQHVEENVASAGRSGIGLLSPDDLALMERVRDTYEGLFPSSCTGCRYCIPCPNGVAIPDIFEMFNNGVVYDRLDDVRRRYLRGRLHEGELASACVQCRECEDKCPQNITISEWMPYIHGVLGEGKPHEPETCSEF